MREVYLPAYSVGDDAIASSGSAFRRLGQNGIIIGGHHALDAAGESLRDALKKADVRPIPFGMEANVLMRICAGWPNGLKPVARIW